MASDVPFAPHRLEGTPYRLDALLGEGAMGEVYLGEHVDLRRPAVIKLIRAKYAREEQVVGRMRREARIVARIRHDALVTIYDLGVAADGRTFIAMEYLEGTVLRRILQTRGALPVEEATRLMAQACDGLEVAHQAGVIHRDVKPENLFVTATGQLKVLDFGVAKPMHEGDMTSARTAAGMVLGTPRYMAPEQATGRALSAATDVYAVGCVLFELLAGMPLFDHPDARELLYHHMHTRPPTLAERTRRAFAPELEAIVARALAKDPAQRYPRAGDLAAALRAFGARVSVPPRASVSPHDKDTVRLDQTPTVVAHDDVHRKPTVRVEQNTRAVSAQALIDGVSTTEQHAAATDPVASAPTEALPLVRAPIVEPDIHTSETEVLAQEPATPGGTGSLAHEVSTSPIERRGTPLWPFAVGAAVVAVAVTAIVLVARGGREEPLASNPTKTVDTAQTAPAVPSTPASSEPTSEPTSESNEAPSAPGAVATKGETKPLAKPAKTTTTSAANVAASAAPSAAPIAPTTSAPEGPKKNLYESAKASMAAGDLDVAENEARFAIATHGNAARLLLGEILERKGKTALAKEQYKAVLASDPNNMTAKTRLAKLGG